MKTTFTIVLLIFSLSIFSKEIPVEKAKVAATNFLMLNTSTHLKANTHFELTLVTTSTPHAFNQSTKKSDKIHQIEHGEFASGKVLCWNFLPANRRKLESGR